MGAAAYISVDVPWFNTLFMNGERIQSPPYLASHISHRMNIGFELWNWQALCLFIFVIRVNMTAIFLWPMLKIIFIEKFTAYRMLEWWWKRFSRLYVAGVYSGAWREWDFRLFFCKMRSNSNFAIRFSLLLYTHSAPCTQFGCIMDLHLYNFHSQQDDTSSNKQFLTPFQNVAENHTIHLRLCIQHNIADDYGVGKSGTVI